MVMWEQSPAPHSLNGLPLWGSMPLRLCAPSALDFHRSCHNWKLGSLEGRRFQRTTPAGGIRLFDLPKTSEVASSIWLWQGREAWPGRLTSTALVAW